MPKEKSAGAIILRKEDNKIYYLLLHYHSGHWEFPKGHIEGKEGGAKCERCGNCIREFFVTRERMREKGLI